MPAPSITAQIAQKTDKLAKKPEVNLWAGLPSHKDALSVCELVFERIPATCNLKLFR